MSAIHVNRYVAYLIRLWSETPGVWRGMLIDPNSGERHYFADLDELQAFLRDRVCQFNGDEQSGTIA